MAKNRVEVVIDGQIITLVSDEKEAYMQKVALYIDKKLGEIKSSKSDKPISEYLRALLISVNIADDYFKAEELRQDLEYIHKNYVHEMERMQEENILITEKLHELQARLSYARDQHIRETGQLKEENAKLNKQASSLKNQFDKFKPETTKKLEELREESIRLDNANLELQKQLKCAKDELEEYINTFDGCQTDRQNVVNFTLGAGR